MSSAERAAPDRWLALPIFPLPGVQLFPHALLPLHVFEPRYRDMVRDAMAGDRLIAVASLDPGYEADYHGRPPVRAVVGVGRIIGHEPVGDGRANIVLRGLARARIDRELPARQSYRLVDATTLADRRADAFDDASARETLELLAEQLARKLPSGGDTLRELVAAQPDAAALVDVLAAALITQPDDRQLLLESTDVGTRVDRVSAEIASLLGRLAGHDGPAN